MWELSVQLLVPIRFAFIRAQRVPGTVLGAGNAEMKAHRYIPGNVVNPKSRCTSGALCEHRRRQRVGAGHGGEPEELTAEPKSGGWERDGLGSSQRQHCEVSNAGAGRGSAPTVSARRPL